MIKTLSTQCGLVLVWALVAGSCLAQGAPASGTTTPDQKAGGVKSLEKRVLELEKALGRQIESDKWYDRLLRVKTYMPRYPSDGRFVWRTKNA